MGRRGTSPAHSDNLTGNSNLCKVTGVPLGRDEEGETHLKNISGAKSVAATNVEAADQE